MTRPVSPQSYPNLTGSYVALKPVRIKRGQYRIPVSRLQS